MRSKQRNAINTAFKVFIFLLLGLFAAIKVVNASSPLRRVEDLRGEWVSSDKYVNITFDEFTNDSGPLVVRFGAVNTSTFVTVDYFLENPLNLSENRFIVFEIKIRNVSIGLPLGIVLFDDYEQRRGFGDIVDKYGLCEMEWAVIALDTGKSCWEDIGFDSSSVTYIRFNCYNGEELYSQTVWVKYSKSIEYQACHIPLDSIEELTGIRYFLSILFLICISFVIGFLTFKAFKLNIRFNSSPILMWPFCAAFGLCFLVLVLFLVSLFYLDKAVSVFIVGFSFSLFVVINAKNLRNFKINGLTKHILKMESLIPISIYILSIVGFSYLAIYMYWPVPGDPLVHGKVVGIIIEDKKTTSNLMSSFPNSIGFHLLSTFLSSITNLYPGQSILVVGTVIVILLSCLIFSAMYRLTRSLELSIIGYSLLYFLPESSVPMWKPSQNLLVGKYLPGVYPNLMADLIFITFISLHYFYMRNESHSTKAIISILLVFSLLLSYFSFLPFLVMFFVLGFLFTKKNPSTRFYIHKVLAMIFLMILYLCLTILAPVVTTILKADIAFRYDKLLTYGLLKIDSPYFIYTIIAFLAFPVSIWIIAKREKFRDWGILYLALFLPTIFSFHEQIYNSFLWFLRIDRFLILLVTVCYFILLIGILHLFEKGSRLMRIELLNQFRLKASGKSFKRYSKIVGVLLLIFASIAYFFLVSSSVEQYYHHAFNSRIPSRNDFLVMEWLADNVSQDEVVLNDRTYAALWLPSFKALDIINERDLLREIYLFGTLNYSFLANRTVEADKILAYPWNYRLIERIIDEYNISYVYISENEKQFEHLGRGVYLPNFPWTGLNQKERIIMYLMNSKMELVFQSGDASVLKVKKPH